MQKCSWKPQCLFPKIIRMAALDHHKYTNLYFCPCSWLSVIWQVLIINRVNWYYWQDTAFQEGAPWNNLILWHQLICCCFILDDVTGHTGQVYVAGSFIAFFVLWHSEVFMCWWVALNGVFKIRPSEWNQKYSMFCSHWRALHSLSLLKWHFAFIQTVTLRSCPLSLCWVSPVFKKKVFLNTKKVAWVRISPHTASAVGGVVSEACRCGLWIVLYILLCCFFFGWLITCLPVSASPYLQSTSQSVCSVICACILLPHTSAPCVICLKLCSHHTSSATTNILSFVLYFTCS